MDGIDAFLEVDSLDQWNSKSAATTFFNRHYILLALLTALTVCIFTRLSSTKEKRPRSSDGARRPPGLPYWIPFVGHAIYVTKSPQAVVAYLQSQSRQGIITLKIFGSRIHYIRDVKLIKAICGTSANRFSNIKVQRHVLIRVFGMPSRDQAILDAVCIELASNRALLDGASGLDQPARDTVQRVQLNMKDLVTGNVSEVDQLPWERASRITVVSGQGADAEVEADLFPLILHFLGHQALPSIMGTDLLENHPALLSDLWTFDRAFVPMLVALPRGVPVAQLTMGHVARKTVLDTLWEMEDALQKDVDGRHPGVAWSNLHNVCGSILVRQTLYQKHNLSLRGRAAFDFSTIWSTVTDSCPLAFWMLVHVYSNESILAKLRTETTQFVTLATPAQGFSIPEPVRFDNVDVESLLTKCPTLRGAYLECLRLHSAAQHVGIVEQDLVLQGSQTEYRWLLQKGDWCWLSGNDQQDAKYYQRSHRFQPDRHVNAELESAKEPCQDESCFKQIGSDVNCIDAFPRKYTLVVVAMVVALWDMAPAEEQWRVPANATGLNVLRPAENLRVRLKHRKLEHGRGTSPATP